MPWIIATTLTVFIPLIVLYWYVGKKLINALTWRFALDRSRVKQIIISIVAALNAFPVIVLIAFLVSGRSRVAAFAGESVLADILLVYPFWFGLVVTVQSCILFLTTDIARLIMRPLYRKTKERWLRAQSTVVLGLLTFVTVYSAVVIALDTWSVQIVRRDFRVPEKASGLAGLNLVHISDVQGDGRTTPERLKNYARLVNEQQPDVIFFAGDLITSGERYIDATGDVMGLMEARLAKIAAVGDHDLFSNREMAVNALRRNGFQIADDTTVVVQTDSGRISVTLLTHTYRQRPDSADLENALVGADGGLKVLLVHQPAESLVAFGQRNGFDLFLAGHTHGGGVAFGIPGLFLISPAAFESRFVSGFYEVGEMIVSVTNGIGMTLAPIRFHAPAQITVIRLVP